jgi:hypothetical protein
MDTIDLNKKLLNLTKREQESFIYRIFSIERLLEVLENKKLTLVQPRKWDDPFENYVFNKLSQTQKSDKGKKFFEEYQYSLYGQCWSFLIESDAMWRIYAPNKNGVKVKVLVSTLEKILPINYFLGKVNYCKKRMLENFYNEMKHFTGSKKDDMNKFIQSILLKRTAFKHEKEVRLIYFEQLVGFNTENKELQIEPDNLFCEIVFDPRLDKYTVKALTEYINNHYNKLKKINIKQSKLYQLPEFN